MAKIDIAGMLNAATVKGHIAAAQQIIDEEQGRLQSEINKTIPKLQESTEEEIEDMIANGTWKEGVIYYTVEE